MPDWAAEYAALSAAGRISAMAAMDCERLAVAAYMTGHDADVVVGYTQAFEEYLRLDEPESAVRCGIWAGFLLDIRGDHARASGWRTQVTRILGSLPDESTGVTAVLALAEAVRLMHSGDVQSALAMVDEAAGRWPHASGDVLALAGSLRGRCLVMLGRDVEAVAALDDAMHLVVAGRVEPFLIGFIYCGVIELCMRRLDVGRAQEWTAALSEWVGAQAGMVPYRGTCLVHQATILQLRGEWPAARRQAHEACDALQASGEATIGMAHYRVAELARLGGRYDEADHAYRRAAAGGADPQPGLALLRLAQGRAEDAAAGLDRALAESHAYAPAAPMLGARIEVALAAGDHRTASQHLETLRSVVEPAAPPYPRALAEHCSGAVLLARGDAPGALRSLRRACALWDEVDAPYESAQTQLLVATACERMGDADSAQMQREAAHAALARILAVDAEVPAVTAAAPHDDQSVRLSERELEVLRLVATGATNRMIARHLFLSEKTVARHVSNVLAKLDVPSRAAATAYAYEHHLVPLTG